MLLTMPNNVCDLRLKYDKLPHANRFIGVAFDRQHTINFATLSRLKPSISWFLVEKSIISIFDSLLSSFAWVINIVLFTNNLWSSFGRRGGRIGLFQDPERLPMHLRRSYSATRNATFLLRESLSCTR